MKDAQRIVFLDYLRALACLLVVFGHVYLIGFNFYEGITPWVPSVKGLIFGPDAPARNVFTWPFMTLAVKTDINVGALGISLFFLISGFVILRAAERESTLTFLVRRIFRIYPVNLACVFLAGGVTAIYCAYTGTVSPHSLTSILSSGFVANGFLRNFETTPVLWSLEVELIFYVLMAVLAARGAITFQTILNAACICAVFTYAARAPAAADLPASLNAAAMHLSFTSTHIGFLLVGSMIYRASQGGALWRGAAYVAASIAVFCAARWAYVTEHAGIGGVDLVNGFVGLALFGLALRSGMHWKWIRPLKWVADISYPLYVVHVPLAWICLAWLASLGFDMPSAGVLSLVIVTLVAWGVHVTIETRAQRMGAALARWLSAYRLRRAEMTPYAEQVETPKET